VKQVETFEVVIVMLGGIGEGEDVHAHNFFAEGKNEFDVFQQIKDCNWFHYENKSTHNFIQVKNIADILIRGVAFDD
jgi:hypothetical protein